MTDHDARQAGLTDAKAAFESIAAKHGINIDPPSALAVERMGADAPPYKYQHTNDLFALCFDMWGLAAHSANARNGEEAALDDDGPVTDAMVYAFHRATTDGPLGEADFNEIRDALRAALLAASAAPAPKCDTCNDTGQRATGHSGRESDGNAMEFERCPECGYGDAAPAPAAQADDSVLWSLNRELGAALSEARRPIINRQQTTALMQMVNVALSQQSATPAGSTAANFDDYVVEQFAVAMKRKLAAARAKGRGGWQYCTQEDLSRMLREHVEKGDARDVANFCMFLWYHGYAILATPADAASEADKRDAERYRVLRDERYQLDEDDISVSDSSFQTYFGDELDAAVDALAQRERQQGAGND